MQIMSLSSNRPYRPRLAFVAGLTAICLSSCGKPALSLIDVPGVWQSDGYGWLITIKDGKAGDVYHAGDGFCLKIKDDEIGATIAGLSPIALEGGGNAFTAGTSENITQFRFRKAAALPKECANASALNPDPIVNFDLAWKHFDTHHAFFKAQKVDWKSVYGRYRPQVTPQTSSEELYTILSAMLTELNDRHVIINHSDGREFRAGLGPVIGPWVKDFARDPQGTESAIDYVNKQMAPYKALVETRYMTGPVGRAGQGQIAWGRLKGDIGYIRLDSFSYFDARDGYKYQKAELDAVMTKAMIELKDVKGFVIDMRFNLGGNDGLGLILASHFADKKRLAYTKQARMGGGVTALQKVNVVPAKQRFGGKVAVLIGNVTVSAGENFTIATLPYPQIFRVGETTAGALADVLMKPLPNGWRVGISNEIFRGAGGQDVETIGITPDIAVPNHFSSQTLTTKRDMVLETALTKLNQ
jgi:Peptidase family S41/Tricorn protease C1 domain